MAASPGSTIAGCATRCGRARGATRSISGRSGAGSPVPSCWCAAPSPTCFRRRSPSACSRRIPTRATPRSPAPATRCPAISPPRSAPCSPTSCPPSAAGAPDLAVAETARRVGAHLLHGARLLVGVALLGPRVGVHVVAVLLPEPGRVDVEELEGAKPLRALPEVELGQDQPYGPAVVGLEVAASVLERQDDVVLDEIVERRVGGVVRVGVLHDERGLGSRPYPVDDRADRHAFPDVVELRPARHAVDVRGDRDPRQLQELRPGPRRLVLDEPVAAKRPAGWIEARRAAVREHGPLGRQDLTGWNTRRERGIDLLFWHLGHYTTRPEAFGRMESRRIMT